MIVEGGTVVPEQKPQLPGESVDEYTDRLIRERRPGCFRQCTIGWHEECSDPHGEECTCDCHMQAWAVTFGVKYRNEPWPGRINDVVPHPDGWILVVGRDYGSARAEVVRRLGDKWAFMYPMGQFDQSHHPAGELTRINAF